MSNWIDVSQPLKPGMIHWPGQTPLQSKLISSIKDGHMANVTELQLSVHTGTHMDAPLHFIAEGKDIASMPPSAGIGKVRVMKFEGEGHIEPDHLKEYQKRTAPLKSGERLFFRTRHSDEDWIEEDFNTEYTALSAEAAKYLADLNLLMIGIDYLSIAPYGDLPTPHHHLLGKEIWIVEGLKLTPIKEGEYELICLPLKIEGSDGSPARVLMRPLVS